MDAKTKIMQAVESKNEELTLQHDKFLVSDGSEDVAVVEDSEEEIVPGAHLEFEDEDDRAWLLC